MYYKITVRDLVKMIKERNKMRFQSLKYEIIFLTLQAMKNELLLNGAFQHYKINTCSFSCSNVLMIR